MDSKIAEILEEVFRYGVGTNSDDIRGNDTAYLNLRKYAVAKAATQLQQLMIEARIDELELFASRMNKLRTSDGFIPVEYSAIRTRISELQAQLNKEVE